MLRWVILAVAVVALTALATLVVEYVPSSDSSWNLPVRSNMIGPQPKVVVEGALTHEFGAMSQQRTGNHSWVVRNLGKGELELWMESSTCMCTIAKLANGNKAVVKPGESTEIDLEWKTNNTVGVFNKGATIGTNDPSRPSFTLAAHGTVHPPVVVLPSEEVIQMGSISNDETKIFRVAIFAPDRPELKLTKISTSRPDLLFAQPAPLTPDECESLKIKAGYRLNLEIKPGTALGTFRDEVVVQTDHPLQSEVRLIVAGAVTGPISVVPDHLRMVTVKSREGASEDITLLVRAGKATNFEVAHKPEKVEVSIAPNETSSLKGRYRLTVTIPPGTLSGYVDDQIILRTDHPKVSELKIPVSIVVGAG
jgi:hypothetical protein